MQITKTCPVCNRNFRHRSSVNRVTCSIRCRSKLMKKIPKITKICEYCKNKFQVIKYKKKQRFCSNVCSHKSRTKLPKSLTKSRMRDLLLDYNQYEISEIYNVSQGTIRKWCKKLGVETISYSERCLINKSKKPKKWEKTYKKEERRFNSYKEDFRNRLISDMNKMTFETLLIKYALNSESFIELCKELNIQQQVSCDMTL